MGYLLSLLFPLFLTFMASFWHKNECLPITAKYLSYYLLRASAINHEYPPLKLPEYLRVASYQTA